MRYQDLLGQLILHNGFYQEIVAVTINILGVWIQLEDGDTVKYEEDRE